MRTRVPLLRLLTALLVSALLGPAAVSQEKEWEKIPTPLLKAFEPRQPKRIVLPNGMVIFLQEDHELPLVNGWFFVRGGGREVPADKTGLASIYGQAWRTGGTQSRTGDQIDEFLEARGAFIETGADEDSSSVFFSALKENLEEVFPLALDVLQNPEFREDKIALAKTQENSAISRRNDSFTSIAAREAFKLAYGADNPYARQTEYATVAAVKRDDLRNWHKNYVHASNLIVAVLGDFDSAAMEARLRKAFAAWPKKPAHKPALVEFRSPKPGVYFIPKDDINQSAIRMVDLGVRRDHPDYFAVLAMNEVLGGGFGTRLVTNIRSKKGLAYTVGGGVGSAWDHPGVLQFQMTTKSGTTAESIHALYEEIDGIVGSRPATEAEVQKARETILNSFVFNFDTPQEVLLEQVGYEFYGYPPDFLKRYQEAIRKVTAEEVNRVAKKYLRKNKLAVLVVGKEADFDKPLSSLGPVTTLDIAIPEPAMPGADAKTGGGGAAPAASTAEGKALLARVVEGLGGREKVDAVKSIRLKATMLHKTPQGDINTDVEAVMAFPDRLHMAMRLPSGDLTTVLKGNEGFMVVLGMTRDLPPPMKDAMIKDQKREMLMVVQQSANPKYVFTAGGTEKVGDVETLILNINADGSQARWYVDPKSGRVLRASYQAMEMTGPVQRVVDYSDWKTVGGITLPMKNHITSDGQESGGSEAMEVEFNPAVDPKLFEKPAGEPAAEPPPG
ncbi:MAG: insulinase family protein [Acidobacteria bacterium]|nr:insulinase family protein [Acidobacteriota bacterium]